MNPCSFNPSDMAELDADSLVLYCDPDQFDFKDTSEIENGTTVLNQDRLASAMAFGIGIRREGYNIFALGSNKANKQEHIRQFVHDKARDMPTPPDLCYVNNFEEVTRPKVLTLPASRGCTLRDMMDDLTEDLIPTLTSALETEEYQNRKQAIQEEVQKEQEHTFEEIRKRADEKQLTLMKTAAGFSIVPVRDGEVLKEDELKELPEEERKEIREHVEELRKELQKVIRQMPSSQRIIRKRVKELDREIASYALRELFSEVREAFDDLDEVIRFLEDVKQDIVENVQAILRSQMQAQGQQSGGQEQVSRGKAKSGAGAGGAILDRYRVNLLVDHCDSEGAPVVYEDNPGYKNLLGRVEYQSRMGALTTNFNLIKPGSLHRANGGYLILDARRVLMEPFAWEGLKRVLNSGEIRIESLGESFSAISTVSLEPEAVELDLKVVLLGSRMLYYMLCEYDPDVKSLFKVEADFDDEIEQNSRSITMYVQLIAGLVKRNDLRPFSREAVMRVITHSARLADDRRKLSTATEEIKDLLLESDYWAEKEVNKIVQREDVQKAIDQQRYRSGRIKDRVQESIVRDTLFIDTEGDVVGQINGLSVTQIGNLRFGRPTRITARVQIGKGEIIDIEREVEMSGPLHSKGVLIMKGFLGERYAQDRPLSLSASLVFEQSYGPIDGDSASSAELYVLLSAIAELPLNQSMSVTGSVNQHGKVQPIGGVNEKIEGFFDVCRNKGLTGDQGVIIPAANEKNLLLRSDVVEAVKSGNFHIWSVNSIDEGMELLTDMKMGERNSEGNYPEDSVNGRIMKHLDRYADQRKTYLKSTNGEGSG